MGSMYGTAAVLRLPFSADFNNDQQPAKFNFVKLFVLRATDQALDAESRMGGVLHNVLKYNIVINPPTILRREENPSYRSLFEQ